MKKNRSTEIGLLLVIVMFFTIFIPTSMTIGHNVIGENNIITEKYYFDKCIYSNYYNTSKIFNDITFNSIKESINYYNIESIKVSDQLQLLHLVNGPINSSWPVQCHDNHHTSRSPYSTANNPGVEKWRLYDEHWIDQSPVIDSNGVIYICDDWGVVTAVYPDGTINWRYTVGGQIMGSSAAIAEDGTIYVGSWDTKLYAINPNGSLKWSCPTHGSIASSPVIAENGTIYVGNYDKKLVAVNPNGTIDWYYDLEDDTTSDPAIGNDGTVYIGSLDSYLYALYPNGTLKWRFKTGDRIYGSPSIADDGTIYIGSSWDSYLYAVYPNGTMKWKYSGAGTPNNPSIGADGTIYAGYLYNLVALNPNGSLKWSFYIGDNRFIGKSAPAISADGTIYFGIHLGYPGNSDGGEIIAVNPDGTEKWRKRIANYWVESSPSIGEDGTVYIGCAYAMSEGYLHTFGTVENNEPPSIPTITGPTSGNTGVKHTYTFISNDPENYPVKYYIEWGDDTSTGWTEEYESGEEVIISHTWFEEGTYTIRAKVMDISNDESNWGTLTVTMPRNRIINIDFFLQYNPNFAPIIRFLLKL